MDIYIRNIIAHTTALRIALELAAGRLETTSVLNQEQGRADLMTAAQWAENVLIEIRETLDELARKKKEEPQNA